MIIKLKLIIIIQWYIPLEEHLEKFTRYLKSCYKIIKSKIFNCVIKKYPFL